VGTSNDGVSGVELPLPCNNNLKLDSLRRTVDEDVWSIYVEQIWIEFVPISQPASYSGRNQKTSPFVESFPVTLWVVQRPDSAKRTLNTDTAAAKGSGDEISIARHVIASPRRFQQCSSTYDVSGGSSGDQLRGGIKRFTSFDSMQVAGGGTRSEFASGDAVCVVPSCSAPERLADGVVGVGGFAGGPRTAESESVLTESSSEVGRKEQKSTDVHLLLRVGTKIKV